jgi:3-oxocholest-4-en-26-oyl-CoA dehydrogenase beta subunit
MDFDLTKEQKILKQSARDFLKKECPPSLLRELKSDPEGYLPRMWKKMADLGWTGVMIPESFNGIGGDFIELSILLEAMGEVNCPSPFFSTIVLGALPIMLAGNDKQKEALLPQIADGKLLTAFALIEPGQYFDPVQIAMKATSDTDGYVLTGTKLFVENAHIADKIICAARTGGAPGDKNGLTLFIVDAKAPGIRINRIETLAHDHQCEVALDRVRVSANDVLGPVNCAFEILEGIQARAVVAKCAELVGCLQTAFDMSVSYAKERNQFNRPIGSFQAVQHHLANMVLDVDGARFITYQAAWKIARDLPFQKDASMCKAWTGTAARQVTTLAHQIHGAIGFCEEMDLHLYYRRAKAGEVFFGDPAYHLEKVAQAMGL